MLSSQRKQTILALLAQEKQVQSRDLSQRFGLSEDSIRRDLRELAAEGLLQRVHGGALPVSAALGTLETRKSVQTASKRVIAQKAVTLIQPGQIVLFDGGTTSAELVNHLPDTLRFTAITHSPSVALALAGHPQVEIILLGGQLYRHSVVTVGAAMLESLSRINADLFFMGVTGVHQAAGLTTGNFEEATVKRALAGRAAETVVLASAEKLNAASAFAIGELSLASTLVTETAPDEALSQALHQQGVTII
ncbi:DeoR/GlpR family DNA-binding transcription regulator [Pantoea sp.]|uniref:DeoR/GlpR family DNA-binding transcription regulator n=1 Tax=Pantoea sp. TaxID=69393 RepID=UPI0028AACAC2|nr:DeoR/GlpR family DNA-binding transcription regulator [Pantoea sp.]